MTGRAEWNRADCSRGEKRWLAMTGKQGEYEMTKRNDFGS
jgi:hypothetical protein